MLKTIYRWLVGEDLNLLVGELHSLEQRFDTAIRALQRDQVNCINLLEYYEANCRELKARVASNKTDIELAAKLQGRLRECLR